MEGILVLLALAGAIYAGYYSRTKKEASMMKSVLIGFLAWTCFSSRRRRNRLCNDVRRRKGTDGSREPVITGKRRRILAPFNVEVLCADCPTSFLCRTTYDSPILKLSKSKQK